VFTHPQAKKALMNKIEDSSFGKYLLFNDYENVVEDFFEGWMDLNGNEMLIDK
jgi:hypothetical protein